MAERRSTPSLPTPFRDLSQLPTCTLSADSAVWRVVGHDHRDDPIWFGCSGDGRFDLHPHDTDGVCYVGLNPASAVLEWGFRKASPTQTPLVLTPGMFKTRHLRRLETHIDHVLVDSTCEEASGHGITTELGSITPYKLPQWWSQAIHETGPPNIGGILYEPRHHRTGRAAAVYGVRGVGSWADGDVDALTTAKLRAILAGTGAEVLDPPATANDVHVIEPD